MRPQWGKANTKEKQMSEKGKHLIVSERPPSEYGIYQYTEADGSAVYSNPSGAVRVGENGEVVDILFFISPNFLRKIGSGDNEKR